MPAVKAVAKGVGVAPKRLKPMIDLVRGKRVVEALVILQHLPSPTARDLYKAVRAAAANAENNLLMDPNNLKIVSIMAGQGPSLKRFDPRARGKMGRVHKRSSHVTVVVDEEGT